MKSVTRYFARITPMQWFVALSVITVVLAIGLPPDPKSLQDLHTSESSFRIAVGLLLIPYVVIWYFGFFTFGRMKSYVAHIVGSKEESGFVNIALGMQVLAFGLVIPTMISLILSNIAVHNPGFKAASVILTNYISLFVSVVIFVLLGEGVHKLAILAKVRPSYRQILAFMLVFTIIGVSFCYLVLHNYFQSGSPYHLSLWPLLLTYITPYLFAWFVGLFCAFELRLYSHRVSGKLYRQSLSKFSAGLLVAIAGSIILQFVGSALANNKNLHLAQVLLIEYVLLVVVAVGLALISAGAKGLRRIEEV